MVVINVVNRDRGQSGPWAIGTVGNSNVGNINVANINVAKINVVNRDRGQY